MSPYHEEVGVLGTMLMSRLISCYLRFSHRSFSSWSQWSQVPWMLIRSGSVVTLCGSHGWQLWNKAHTFSGSVLYRVSELERIGLFQFFGMVRRGGTVIMLWSIGQYLLHTESLCRSPPFLMLLYLYLFSSRGASAWTDEDCYSDAQLYMFIRSLSSVT